MGGIAIANSISNLRDEIKSLRNDNAYLRRDVNDVRVRLEDLLRVVDVKEYGKDGEMGDDMGREMGAVDHAEEGSLSLDIIDDIVEEEEVKVEDEKEEKEYDATDVQDDKSKKNKKRKRRTKAKERKMIESGQMGEIDDNVNVSINVVDDDDGKCQWGRGGVNVSSGVLGSIMKSKMIVMISGALVASLLVSSIVVRAQGNIVYGDDEYSNDDGEGGGGTVVKRLGLGGVRKSITSSNTDDPDAIASSTSDWKGLEMEKVIREKIKSRRFGGMRPLTPPRREGHSLEDDEEVDNGDEGRRNDAPPSSSRGLQADSSLFATDPTIAAASETPTPDPTYYTSYTYQPTHSPSYVCNSDPVNCGCPNLWGSDYRGTINTTKSGKACVRWDDPNLNKWHYLYWEENLIQDNPNAGLEGNFCRNPDDDSYGPWCYTGATADDWGGWWDYDYCDVPVCDDSPTASPSISAIPTSSSRPTSSTSPSLGPTSTSLPTGGTSGFPSLAPSLSSSPTNTCHIADKSTCGCDDVDQSDYRGTISTTEDGTECARWDSDWMRFSDHDWKWFEEHFVEIAGLDENYCRDPFDEVPVSNDRRPGAILRPRFLMKTAHPDFRTASSQNAILARACLDAIDPTCRNAAVPAPFRRMNAAIKMKDKTSIVSVGAAI